MRIAYVNTKYRKNHTGGGHVHMGQFIKNALTLGNEIWVYPSNHYPGTKIIPTDHINHIKTMRQMDALYIRLESDFPQICTWSLPPRRFLYNFPLVVWEFNTIPEDAKFRGVSQNTIDNTIATFQHYGRGCDLGICVAPAAEKYVQEKLRVKRTLVVNNGSDPNMFDPNVEPVPRMSAFQNNINIVWIGSAKIKYHDFDILREAGTILWKHHKYRHILFHIIGPDLKLLMADMPPNVFYWGAEDYERIPNWLSAMDIGLYITKGGYSTFGSPLKVFDYMSCGLPVVSTIHPAVGELFKQLGQTDLMLPLGNAQMLATTIINLSENEERRDRLGLAGRRLIIEKYNWSRAVEKTITVMEKLLSNLKSNNPMPVIGKRS